MQQAHQKRLTPDLLALKQVHWNLHEFIASKRKKRVGRLVLTR
jgi:hypothetical protein